MEKPCKKFVPDNEAPTRMMLTVSFINGVIVNGVIYQRCNTAFFILNLEQISVTVMFSHLLTLKVVDFKFFPGSWKRIAE